jgi:hypothetical protein
MFVCLALIFSGCEQEAETETQTVTNHVAGDLAGLEKLLSMPGVNTVDFYGDLTIGTDTLYIPAGKTVTLQDGGITLSANGILGVLGTLTLPEGKKITGAGAVAGSDDVLALVAESGGPTKAKLYDSITEATAAFDDAVAPVTAAALVDVSSGTLTADAVKVNKTLYVLGDLTVTDAPAAAGSVKALGRLVFGATTDISSLTTTQYDYSNATLATTAAATVTLPSTATLKAIDATRAKLTIAGGTTPGISLSVGGITGEVALTGTVTLTDKVTVAANATLTVATDATFTVANGATLSVAGTVDATAGTATITGTLTVTGDGLYKENATSSFTLSDKDGTVDVIGKSSILGATALKEVTSALTTVTVTLTSKTGQTFTGTADFTTNGNWGAKRTDVPDWTWGDVSLNVKSLLTDIANEVLSVYSTNEAYVYYKGSTNDIATSPLTTKPAKDTEANIYIPESGLPYKWKANAANAFASTTTWGIILAKEAPTKIITLKILTHSDYNNLDAGTHVKTLVINYSGVTIAEPSP